MEFRWDGAQAEKNLGDSPTKSQINALFAIPGDTKSDSSLPHHSVSADGTVGAADKDGCTAAIGALNGGRGGVNATQAEKNRAYSHLASHLRAMGETPPDKQFAAGRPLELRAQRRLSMLRVPERLALPLVSASLEMRAKANGTGGTSFHFTGYFLVYSHPFQMYDWWGDEFTEIVQPGAITRTLANGCDVPFLIGHNDAGIPMARTKSGTMTLGQDSHGGWVDAPALDGSLEQIRQLASAVERGDMDEMSCAFMTLQQQWSPDYEQRDILEMDLHKGDVSVVVFGANDATSGASMAGFPAEALTLRRPTGIRQRHGGEARRLGESSAPDYDPQPVAASHEPVGGTHVHMHPAGDGTVHAHAHTHGTDGTVDAAHGHGHFYDAGGAAKVDAGALYDADGKIIIDEQGIPEEIEGEGPSSLALRRRELELLKLAAG